MGISEELKLQLDRMSVAGDYKAVFLSQRGRKVLKDLAKNCYYDTDTLHPDALKMAHREGRRSVVLDILSKLSYTMDDMLDEEFSEQVDL